MIITKSEVNTNINKEIASYLSKGYTVTSIQQIMDGLISAELVNKSTKDKVNFNVAFSFGGDLSHTDFTIERNGKVIKLTTLYKVGSTTSSAFVTTESEANAAYQIRKTRRENKLSYDEVAIPVTRQNVLFIRNIKGLKTVARKNIKLTR